MRRRALILVVAGATLLISVPAAVSAAPILCDPFDEWTVLNSQSTTLWAQSDDMMVYSAPSSAPLTVTHDITGSTTRTATVSTTSGTSISGGVAVGWFNAAAGYTSGESAAMETSDTYSHTVSTNITIPAGHSMVEYIGFQVTTARMTRYRCSSNGQTVSTKWAGTVVGPRLRAYGWIDCRDTSLC